MIISHIVQGIGHIIASSTITLKVIAGTHYVRRSAGTNQQYGASIINEKSPAATCNTALLPGLIMNIKGVLPDLCLTFLCHDEPAFLLQLTPSTKCQGNFRSNTAVAAWIFKPTSSYHLTQPTRLRSC